MLDRLAALGFDGVYLKVRPKQANTLVDTRKDELAPKQAVRGTSAADEIEVREEGVPYGVRLGDGLSTGLFLDQRTNRVRVREAAAGKSVLNLFAYTCAFSVAAAVGGAARTVSVDAAGVALERGRQNLARVGATDEARHQLVAADAFDWLAGAAKRKERFDLVDPRPAELLEHEDRALRRALRLRGAGRAGDGGDGEGGGAARLLEPQAGQRRAIPALPPRRGQAGGEGPRPREGRADPPGFPSAPGGGVAPEERLGDARLSRDGSDDWREVDAGGLVELPYAARDPVVDLPSDMPEPTAQGTFASTPLPHVLIHALNERLTGTFELSGRNFPAGTFLVIDGHPAKARTMVDHYLVRVMQEVGIMTEGQVNNWLPRLLMSEELHGRALVRKKVLTPEQVDLGLRAQLVRQMQTIVELPPETVFRYYDEVDSLAGYGDSEIPARPVPVHLVEPPATAPLGSGPPRARTRVRLGDSHEAGRGAVALRVRQGGAGDCQPAAPQALDARRAARGVVAVEQRRAARGLLPDADPAGRFR